MAANTNPIFPGRPDVQGAKVITGNTDYEGATGTVVTVFTAHATEGSRVDWLMVKPLGTNAATVLRIWHNNGSDPTVAENNKLIKEATLASTTASQTAALAETPIQLDAPLGPGHRLLAAVGTTIAAGIHVTAFGGPYVV